MYLNNGLNIVLKKPKIKKSQTNINPLNFLNLVLVVKQSLNNGTIKGKIV